ncbi:MAG: hypothetical protein LBC96_01750 [Lachnospiraceae bacterium]|jgi:hypothetical protein|nr:hypothetical protein [Lachnospiraceae bacterium]
MKRTVISFSVVVLVVLNHACMSKTDSSDDLIPIHGLSFGMSADEALVTVPQIAQVALFAPTSPPSDYLTGAENVEFPPDFPASFRKNFPNDFFNPNVSYFILENVDLWGKNATVRMRFVYNLEIDVSNVVYTFDVGLSNIYITFNEQTMDFSSESVERDKIMDELAFLFDFDRADLGGLMMLYSKDSIDNINDDLLLALQSYMSNMPVYDRDGGQQSSVNLSHLLNYDSIANEDNRSIYASGDRHRWLYFAVGTFNPVSYDIMIEGRLAGLLYRALRVGLDDTK